jgi:uncharacterized Ntn-hydrolase superfamily protein
MTYSIVAIDQSTRELGVGVQTHRPAVGAIVPWVIGGVGAVATQSQANARYGPQALELMKNGLDAEHALAAILAGDDGRESRQVAIIDSSGAVAAFTGSSALEAKGSVQGDGYSCQANMMARSGVPEAMASAFERSSGPLERRMLAALDAAQAAGGDARGMQSASLQVRPPTESPGPSTRWSSSATDFRIDHSDNPLLGLRALLDNRDAERQMDAGAESGSLEQVRANFVEVKDSSLTDELAFWHAVRTLSMKFGEHDEAIELLVPIFEKNSNWVGLMHRLQELPDDSPLRDRFPASF